MTRLKLTLLTPILACFVLTGCFNTSKKKIVEENNKLMEEYNQLEQKLDSLEKEMKTIDKADSILIDNILNKKQ